jgi:DNA-directed RNA polymerase specialized sigma24 family protein
MIGPSFPVVLRAAARGDEGAFERLWYDLQPRLLRYFGVIAPGTAEDLASETWLAVIGTIGRFQGNEPAFRAWVFTIARHKVLDWRRRAARKGTEDLPANGLIEQAAPDDPAADALEGFSTRAALAEVAEIMGKRPGAVRVLTHPWAAPAGPAARRRLGRTRASGGWCNPLAVTPVRPVAVLALKSG